MSTDTHTSGDQPERSARDCETDLLIVGTLGGGGIHHYIDEQAERLSNDVSVRIYDMATEPPGTGLVRFVVSLLRSLLAAIRFPFRPVPDVVHIHTSHRFSFYRASFYVLFTAYVWRCPVILHVHGSSFDEFADTDSVVVRRLQSVVFDASERIIVLSAYWRDILEPRVSPGKLQVLPNAVDPDEYEPGFGSDPLHVVFVSNLIRRKGVPELIDAIDSLDPADAEFRVTIAGSGPLSADVDALASRHEHVTYRGYVSEAEKRRLLASGSVFVLPTQAEGLPIAMLEGMAGENAVVSTTVGSIPEVIGEENGILVDPGDADGLADALEALLTSPGRTERMARRNRALIEEEYSWAEATARLEEAYAAERRRANPG